jgi:hypothetical protein
MVNRLDTQRRPSKAHVRHSGRKYVRGYDTVPHDPWGTTIAGGAVYPATSASAGAPGSFQPEGCATPANAGALTGLRAEPQSVWTTGQYVQTATAGATGQGYWNGSAWVSGAKAP